MMIKQLITISFFACVALGVQAEQDFYKWVDEKGVTHYSQSPPEGMNKESRVETVNVRTRIPVDAEKALADLEKKRGELNKGREEAAAKENGKKNAGQLDAKTRELNKENCVQWQKDLETLQKANIREDDGKGNIKVMTEEDKKKRLEQTRKNIKDFC